MPCYSERLTNGGTYILCGDLGPHCAHCAACSSYLCDFPVGEGKTCDLPLCPSHGHEVAPNIHYCPGHLTLWQAFRDGGGVRRELENVVPYAQQAAQDACSVLKSQWCFGETEARVPQVDAAAWNALTSSAQGPSMAELTVPTLEQIEKFCGHNDPREWIRTPRNEGDFITASNGKVAVRVQATEAFADIAPRTGGTSFVKLIQQACDAGNVLLPIPKLPPANPCQACDGTGKSRLCTSCDGSGEFDHYGWSYDCRPCEGSGQVDADSDCAGDVVCCRLCCGTGNEDGEPVLIGNALYLHRYLALIASLPNARVAPAGNGIAYWAADGCDGALMPWTGGR